NRRPVLVHCMGGRHRTGTISALYRLEYERQPIDAVLREMYSYKFGEAIPPQEWNLRTYVPRPLPTVAEWPNVAAAYAVLSSASPASTLPVLAHRIRHDADDGSLRKALVDSLAREQPFALSMASRVIDRLDDPLLATTLSAAQKTLADR